MVDRLEGSPVVLRPPEPAQVETEAPLLRVVLVVLVLLAVVAGVLVAAGAHAGWIALGLAVVVGPAGVVIDGRARNHADSVSVSPAPEPLRTPMQDRGSPRRAA